MTAPTRPEPVLDWARVVANWQRITAAAGWARNTSR